MERESADDEIRKLASALLAKADAKGRFPTPVSDLITAAGRVEPSESMLSDGVLGHAPEHMRRAIRRLRFKLEAILDRQTKEVHIDPTIENAGRAAFKRLHEVTHHIVPWQQELGYADDRATLSWGVKQAFEREANQGSAELIFQRELFADMAAEYAIGFAAILELSARFGATGHAGFRRYIETHRAAVAGVVLDRSPSAADHSAYRRREALGSAQWESRFGPMRGWPTVLRPTPYRFLAVAEQARISDRPVEFPMPWPDLNQAKVDLHVELYCNQYNIFVLLWPPRRERTRRHRVLVA